MKEEWKVWRITYGTNWRTNKQYIVSIWEISNYGKVKRNGEFVDCKIDSSNRVYVGHTKYRLHRVVYETFIGDIPKGYVIDHIDTNSLNNRLDNLRCCTQYENVHNPLTEKHFRDAMKRRSGDDNYSKIMKKAAKKRRSYKGVNNPMFGKPCANRNRHREYYEDGTYHYVDN